MVQPTLKISVSFRFFRGSYRTRELPVVGWALPTTSELVGSAHPTVSVVRTSGSAAQPAEDDSGSQTLFALLLATVCSMKRTPSRPSYTFG